MTTRLGRRRGTPNKQPHRLYTAEEKAFLKENCLGRSRAEILSLFNGKFSPPISLSQLKGCFKRYGLNTGRTGHFEKGLTPWNLGKNGYMGANRTSFKKGNVPSNQKALYSERVSKDGYIEISLPERNPRTGHSRRYRHKHVWLWEQANGRKAPKGHAVVFKDGDNRNFDTENLMLVSRAELIAMNLHGYKDQPKELKPVVLALAKLEAKAGFRTRPGNGRKRKEVAA